MSKAHGVVIESSNHRKNHRCSIFYGAHDSPYGTFRIALDEGSRICYLGFCDTGKRADFRALLESLWPAAVCRHAPKEIAWVVDSLEKRVTLNVTVLVHGTDFQIRVWSALLETAPGTVLSYGELARQICHPGAARAVGQAVGANRIALLIPCHRVISSNGQLGGYHWGTERKRALLLKEQAGAPLFAGEASHRLDPIKCGADPDRGKSRHRAEVVRPASLAVKNDGCDENHPARR